MISREIDVFQLLSVTSINAVSITVNSVDYESVSVSSWTLINVNQISVFFGGNFSVCDPVQLCSVAALRDKGNT